MSFLRRTGFEHAPALGSERFLVVCREDRHAPDAVLAVLGRPGMAGREVVRPPGPRPDRPGPSRWGALHRAPKGGSARDPRPEGTVHLRGVDAVRRGPAGAEGVRGRRDDRSLVGPDPELPRRVPHMRQRVPVPDPLSTDPRHLTRGRLPRQAGRRAIRPACPAALRRAFHDASTARYRASAASKSTAATSRLRGPDQTRGLAKVGRAGGMARIDPALIANVSDSRTLRIDEEDALPAGPDDRGRP